MKKIISSFKKFFKSQKQKILTAFLLAVFTISSAYLCATKLNVPTNMLSLLPKEQHNPLKQKAFDLVSSAASQRITVLLGNVSREKSYQSASLFNQKISEVLNADAIQFRVNSASSKENLTNLYSSYRHQILSQEYRELLLAKKGSKIRDKAYQSLYSPSFMGGFGSIKDDPFLLSSNFLMSLPFLQSALFPYQDALMAKFEGKYYSFLSITLPKNEVFSTSKLAQIIEAIKKFETAIKAKFPETEIILSGVPIHSHKGSQQGMSEVQNIGLISILGILLLIYFNFRSLKPFFFAICSISTGFVVGFAVTHFVFGQVHIITLIFGTSLIGVSSDYAIHFFCEYLNQKKNEGREVLKHIFSGITMGLITSILGYLVLIFTPFVGLQQIALFSSAGFVASYLVVILVFPKFYQPKDLEFKSPLFGFAQRFLAFARKIISVKRVFYLSILLILIGAFGISKMNFNDDIRLLYSSPQNLINDEIKTRKILGHQKALQFFLIEAKNEQDLLEKEEKFTENLDGLIAQKQLISFQSISQIVPSIKRQKENRQLIKNELMDLYLKDQENLLGIKIANMPDFEKYLTPNEAFQNGNLQVMSSMWLGKIDNKFASIILLDGVKNIPALKNLNNEEEGIYLLDKVEDISNVFKEYRALSFILLIVAHALIGVLLFLRYGRKFIFVLLPPALAGLGALSILGLFEYPINLFNILALFLVLGVGIDYSIFYAEDKKNSGATALAVLIATITTLLSFGLLAFSSFAVLHSFGITILLGILFSYLLAPIGTLANR